MRLVILHRIIKNEDVGELAQSDEQASEDRAVRAVNAGKTAYLRVAGALMRISGRENSSATSSDCFEVEVFR